MDLLLVTWDDASSFETDPEVVPALASLRASGLDLPLTFSEPVCDQSRSRVLFGAYGRSLGIYSSMDHEDPASPCPPSDWPTLAGVLKANGWQTCRVGKWHEGREPSGAHWSLAPRARGFDHFLAGTSANLASYFTWPRWDCGPSGPATPSTSSVYATLAQLDAAQAWWLDHAGGAPRFLHVALNAPHGPWHVPPKSMLGGWPVPALSASKRVKFRAMLRTADFVLGALLDLVGEGTGVFCHADNGTAENVAPPGVPLDHLKQTSFDPGIHVHCAARWPGGPTGAMAGLANLPDLSAAILSAAGVPRPPRWDGHPYARSFALTQATVADGHEEACVRTLTSKLRRARGVEEFYDLQADPGELSPVPLDQVDAGLLTQLRAVLGPPIV